VKPESARSGPHLGELLRHRTVLAVDQDEQVLEMGD
jgi:hypothetical protein